MTTKPSMPAPTTARYGARGELENALAPVPSDSSEMSEAVRDDSAERHRMFLLAWRQFREDVPYTMCGMAN
jgi:hypothetical protein